ncbi:GAF domain-containing protein [Schleiferilactobacillus shenzhenensis]|uniref:YtsP n=1 Tax=Schleiferilactobacillus shenzhenensis LY-73 TaxID=1231336 RepID=U4TQH0_9LACO|nr:GAF domain-containing protein [Schleiferilactobacillus shenzhenensis]ERL66449.1 YtsP [Schleiferilactobacillus shenzhenensis LY-73]
MTDLSLLTDQLTSLLAGETNRVTMLANASALLNDTLPDINWAGFYLYNEATGQLDLGPFQGKVACMHIAPGQGVCGTAYATGQIQRVADVHQFPGHIACDSASNAEIVIPLPGLGVLDIDSPTKDRFSAADEAALTTFAATLQHQLDTAAASSVQ